MSDLAKRIEAGEAKLPEVKKFFGFDALKHQPNQLYSVDAALSLLNKVLPGWQFGVSEFPKNELFSGGMFQAYVSLPDFNDGYAHSEAKTPASAILAAIVRAVEAKGEE